MLTKSTSTSKVFLFDKPAGSESRSNTDVDIESMPSNIPNSKGRKHSQNASTFQYLRYFFLIAIVLQNSGYTLLRRWSTGISRESASDSSMLIGGELIKLTVSIMMQFIAPSFGLNIGAMPMPRGSFHHSRKLLQTSAKMLVPAITYYCMNRLSYVSLRRIDAGTFTVIAQLKTLTTALFSFLILGTQFSAVRVRSLIHLVCSVIVITEFAATHSPTVSMHSDSQNINDKVHGFGVMDVASPWTLGLIAVMMEVTLSGLISVYYQKTLQDDKKNLSAWDRNIQLAVISVMMYFPTFHSDGYFQGWTRVTIAVSVLGSLGGLLVAFSMKYTDAIVKALATSAAIVLTSVLSWMWLDGPYGIPIAVSSVSVIVAILSYVNDGKMFLFKKT